MTDPNFKPMHVTVTRAHCHGNGSLGRFWILPGSRDRAKQIAETFLQDCEVIFSPRGHDGYIGKYDAPDGTVVDIGVISTGMGAPSVDIIATEMIKLGAKVLVRVGTAGAMQKTLGIGDIVIATGAVRDEGTTRHYMPLEYPALGSATVVTAMCAAAQRQLETEDDELQEGAQWVYDAGPVHTKDSLMAREFKFGPYAPEHKRYMEVLEDLGCLASEMEVAMLFSLAQVYGVKAGCVLAIIGGGDDAPISDQAHLKAEAVNRSCSIVCQGMAHLKKSLMRYGRRASLLGRSLSQVIR
ncbi:Uridine phosphorylase, putative [Perkinsus marinus ATCC 50983]|uniref:Uridine phosphorylase, putative n=1 Tax=Perkinsus marinus (strain ATCC 50983 / TXsc) TaxID=423536 RepID=C5LUR0_PERM5|nr:Uridine phosphorylase, putative [Perkinsus marinus ATCC 50983]EEQ99518.1 Uridine phosphorylase, putative [Perkinsus marinus ATCC 50983]|eukprot:XP_002766801.1 Uridine phosphorylase, putative [Perkinsus marinus ATCC 50983]